jgi:hypothetical protein
MTMATANAMTTIPRVAVAVAVVVVVLLHGEVVAGQDAAGRFNWTAPGYAVPAANTDNGRFPYVDCDGTGYLGNGPAVKANSCCQWRCNLCWAAFFPYPCNCGAQCKAQAASASGQVAFSGFPDTSYLTARGSAIYSAVGWTSWRMAVPAAVQGTEVYVSALFASTSDDVDVEDYLRVAWRSRNTWKPLIAFYGTASGSCSDCWFRRDGDFDGEADSNGAVLGQTAARFGTFLILPANQASVVLGVQFSITGFYGADENFAFGGLRVDACKRPSGAASERKQCPPPPFPPALRRP